MYQRQAGVDRTHFVVRASFSDPTQDNMTTHQHKTLETIPPEGEVSTSPSGSSDVACINSSADFWPSKAFELRTKTSFENERNERPTPPPTTHYIRHTTDSTAQGHPGQQRDDVLRLHGRELRQSGEDHGQVPGQLPTGVDHPAARPGAEAGKRKRETQDCSRYAGGSSFFRNTALCSETYLV